MLRIYVCEIKSRCHTIFCVVNMENSPNWKTSISVDWSKKKKKKTFWVSRIWRINIWILKTFTRISTTSFWCSRVAIECFEWSSWQYHAWKNIFGKLNNAPSCDEKQRGSKRKNIYIFWMFMHNLPVFVSGGTQLRRSFSILNIPSPKMKVEGNITMRQYVIYTTEVKRFLPTHLATRFIIQMSWWG